MGSCICSGFDRIERCFEETGILMTYQILDSADRDMWRLYRPRSAGFFCVRRLMARPFAPEKVLIRSLNAVQQFMGTQTHAPAHLKISRNTLISHLAQAKRRGLQADGLKPRVRVKALSEIADSIEQRSVGSEIQSLKNRNKDLESLVIEERTWRRQFESLNVLKDIGTTWLPTPSISKRTSHVVQLFTSDFQCGEKIVASQIDGINEYNQDVFVERYQMMIDKAIDLAVNHSGATDFSGAIYLGGGDAISGEIHEELRETNDLSSIPAVRLLCTQEREGTKRLKDKFGRVRVYRIPGNHGRTTQKPRSKGYSERNFETLLAWWLASTFEDDPNVQFVIPASGDAYYDVMGWKFLMSHGDRMGSRGGQGYIGPAATIARGHAKLYNNYTATGRAIDLIMTGHLHPELKLERGLA